MRSGPFVRSVLRKRTGKRNTRKRKNVWVFGSAMLDPQEECRMRKRDRFFFREGCCGGRPNRIETIFCRNYDGSEDEVWLGCVSDCLIAIEECGPVGKESD